MKQVLQNPSGTVIREVPPPPCPAGNVLVRNEFSVISSGTERAFVEGTQKSIAARVRERPELALKVVDKARREGLRRTRELVRSNLSEETATGYSSAGVVVEVGSAVRGISVGDRVACAGAGYASHAEIVSVPSNLCAKVPHGVPMESAALTTIAAIALHGIRLADVRLGERVAVVGCGLVGQIAARLLAAAGTEVFALDLDPAKVDAAVAAGSHHGIPVGPDSGSAVRHATTGIGVDVVVVTAATDTSDPLVLAAEIARDRGAVVLVGDVPIDVPRALFYEKELSFRVSRSYGPGRYDSDYEERGLDYPIGYVRWTERRNMESVLELQARGQLILRDLIDDVMPIERADEAYARLAGPPETRPRGALALAYPTAKEAGDVAPPPAASVLRAEPLPLAGDVVRVGLLGPGSFANSVLIPAFAEAGASLAVVAGGSGLSAETTARKAGFARVAASQQELISGDDVDAVIVATRHGSHAELVTASLQAGKHVFCEKPLALSQGELDEVVAAAEAGKRVLAVGLNRRFAPHAAQLREFVAGGPMTAIYRVSAGQVDPSHWIHDLEQGGGRLIGECCHFLDTLVFLTGSPISEIHAAGFGGPAQPVQARDNLVISVGFENGSIGTLAYVSDGSPELPKERLEVFAGSRTAVLDDFRTLELYDASKGEKERLRKQDKGHAAEVAAFLAGIRAGSDPVPLAVVENVHRACFAAVDSLRTGRRVRLSPR